MMIMNGSIGLIGAHLKEKFAQKYRVENKRRKFTLEETVEDLEILHLRQFKNCRELKKKHLLRF